MLGRQAAPCARSASKALVGTLQISRVEFRARRRRARHPRRGRVEPCSSSSLPVREPRPPASSPPGSRTRRSPTGSSWLSTVAGLDLAHYGTEADAETIRDTADRPAAAGRHRPDRRPRAVPAPGRRVRPDRRRRRPQRRRARPPPPVPGRSPPSRRWCWSASAARRWPRPPPRTADRHDRRPRRRPRRGARRHRQARPHRRQRQRPRPDRRRRHHASSCRRFADDPPAKARLVPLSVAGAFHTEHMAPAVGHLATLARSVSTHDPRTPCDLQPRRPGRPRRPPDLLSGIVGQIAQPGPLGPLHGDHDRPRRHRHARDAAGGHAHRHRQARPQGRRDVRAQDARPARRRPRVLRQARRGVGDRHLARPGGWSSRPSKGTFHRAEQAGRGDRARAGCHASATSPARATRPRSRAPHGGQSSSGSSRTATWSRPASRWSGSTRREQPDGHAHDRQRLDVRRDPRHRQLPPVSGSSRTPRSSSAIDSSDEWIQQRSGHQAAPVRRRRGDRPVDVRAAPPGRRSSAPASTPARSTASSSRRSPTCCRPPRSRPRSPTSSAPTRPRRSTSRPRAPASATASRSADQMVRGGSAKLRRWSSASSGSPTSPT